MEAGEEKKIELPKMRPCDSKVLMEYGYLPETKQLFLRFVHGRKLYRYQGFPADLYASLSEAVSVGKFFSQRISKNYPGEFVKEEK